MALHVMQCPHCNTPRAPLESVAFRPRDGEDNVLYGFFVCRICDMPASVLILRARPGSIATHDLQKSTKTLEAEGWAVMKTWPEGDESRAPADVPEQVARNFVQAEEARTRNHREAAGMTYRRVLELTLKDIAPELTGTLAKRIDTLATAARLTPDMKDWAHSVRELGNEAAHDVGEPSADDINDLAAFVRVVLEYLYTMPAKVARRTPPSVQA